MDKKSSRYNKAGTVFRYTLRCSIRDDWGKVQVAFDLEVVQVHKTNMMGVLRKRVKGDTWHYKKLCEDILNAAKL